MGERNYEVLVNNGWLRSEQRVVKPPRAVEHAVQEHQEPQHRAGIAPVAA